MFDIEGKHIASLNDADLRLLVARLCETELGRNGLPVSGVIAGGEQDAPDGGIDVRVELPPSTNIQGFIARPMTGFQVKLPDMSPQKIIAEMCFNGSVRPSIQDLASASGAYIIISAKASVTDGPLQRRKAAMREAIATLGNAEKLFVDFYDQNRIASWVRCYPGMVTWVREKIGQPIQGWFPYKNWSNLKEANDYEYILDETCRLLDFQSRRIAT